MTEEYVLLKDSNEIGKIALNKSVFSSIVNISLDEIEGVVKPEKDDHIEIKVIITVNNTPRPKAIKFLLRCFSFSYPF